MNNRNSSPVNLAYDNNNSTDSNSKFKIARILPPFPESNQSSKISQEDDSNLRNFRSKILEMDDEIQQMKQMEREKMMQMNQKIYDNKPPQPKPVSNGVNMMPSYKDEGIATSDLLDEQNRRIMELQNQLEMLKAQLTTKDSIGQKTSSAINVNGKREYNDENMRPYQDETLGTSYDEDEIRQRIGDWSPKDPYQGPMNNLYFPFGSPGGGAPLRDKEGKIQTTLYGPITIYGNPEEAKRRTLATQKIHENMKQELLQQKLKRLQDQQKIKEPDSNLSDIFQNFKGGRPRRDPNTGMILDHHLPSSDVTNIYYATSPRSQSPQRRELDNENDDVVPAGSTEYGLELTKAAREREMMRKLERLREQQEVRQHNEAWNHMWGNSGLTNNAGEYTARTGDYSPGPYTYHGVRRSNHRNFYEIPFN